MTANKNIWVLLEAEKNKLGSYCIGLIQQGKTLSETCGGNLHAVYIGPDIATLDQQVGVLGVKHLFRHCDETLSDYSPEVYEHLLTALLLKYEPYLLLSAATSLGSDLLPRVAAKNRFPLITNCIEIKVDGDPEFIKPVQNGRLRATILCATNGTRMATLSPDGLIADQEARFTQPAQVTEIKADLGKVPTRIRFKGFLKADHKSIDLREAEFVITIGKGIGEKENFPTYERFSDKIGAAIGGSRPVVDAGILPFERQVGQTGKEISPKLVILCGISGSVYFTKGIEGAGKKIAVNTDSKAAILKDADLGIVADVNSLVPEFIEYINGKTEALEE
jgi:electron transfer flavoprotein alpha subunit